MVLLSAADTMDSMSRSPTKPTIVNSDSLLDATDDDGAILLWPVERGSCSGEKCIGMLRGACGN